ncbi:hypothetical protein RQP46_001260 [Phenoliferia psychrophenolica]
MASPAWTMPAASPAWTGRKKTPVVEEEPEAPFLTHRPGPRFALTPPDNHGARRQPVASSSTAPEEAGPPVPKKVKKKKRKGPPKALIDPELILDAVYNAGRPNAPPDDLESPISTTSLPAPTFARESSEPDTLAHVRLAL